MCGSALRRQLGEGVKLGRFLGSVNPRQVPFISLCFLDEGLTALAPAALPLLVLGLIQSKSIYFPPCAELLPSAPAAPRLAWGKPGLNKTNPKLFSYLCSVS